MKRRGGINLILLRPLVKRFCWEPWAWWQRKHPFVRKRSLLSLMVQISFTLMKMNPRRIIMGWNQASMEQHLNQFQMRQMGRINLILKTTESNSAIVIYPDRDGFAENRHWMKSSFNGATSEPISVPGDRNKPINVSFPVDDSCSGIGQQNSLMLISNKMFPRTWKGLTKDHAKKIMSHSLFIMD